MYCNYFPRTAVNAQSGVRTPAAGIITGKCAATIIAVYKSSRYK